MQFRFTIETVTILTDTVESSEDTFVEASFAVDVEERTFGHVVVTVG